MFKEREFAMRFLLHGHLQDHKPFLDEAHGLGLQAGICVFLESPQNLLSSLARSSLA